MTEEHDAQLSYRRASVGSRLGERTAELRRLAAPVIVARACV
ncbi:hypothetical protein [Streptomyces massasporeus]